MRSVSITVCGVEYTGVRTESFIERLRGVHATSPSAEVVIIAGRSVHGWSISQPMDVLGLDASGRSLGVSELRPGRIVTFGDAVAIAEFPARLACNGLHEHHHVTRFTG